MVAKHELESRIHALCKALGDGWDTIFIIGKINQYYLSGTMQDGLLVIKKGGGVYCFARRSFERAKAESPLDVYPMGSYRDAAAVVGGDCGTLYMETETATLGIMDRLKKYFTFSEVRSVEKAIAKVRAVKSDYELSCMTEAGRLHHTFLQSIAPTLLREGMSEAELSGELYSKMLTFGHHGVARFAMFQTELVFGQMGFGENALYPTSFDGPGGMKGMSAAVPVIGSRERRLKKGDLVFIDFAFGVEGYHTDKTQVYAFGEKPSAEVTAIHRKCLNVQTKVASLLKTGSIPSQIYAEVLDGLDVEFLQNFMGFGDRQAKFLGHGTGLQIDEYPVLAKGFDEPLTERMTLAVEPKKGIAGVGVVGVEDTYLVTKDGGKCLTGGGSDIIVV